MHNQPVGSSSLPNSSVTDIEVTGFAIFACGRDVHGNSHPRDVAAARNFQFFRGGQFDGVGVIEEFFFYAFVIFLPTLVGKWRDVVKNQAAVFCVVFCRIVGIAGAPCGAIAVDKFAESSFFGGLLLGECSDKGDQAAAQCEHNIQNPSPTVGTNRKRQRPGKTHLQVLLRGVG
jgi:hypothetical protein